MHVQMTAADYELRGLRVGRSRSQLTHPFPGSAGTGTSSLLDQCWTRGNSNSSKRTTRQLEWVPAGLGVGTAATA